MHDTPPTGVLTGPYSAAKLSELLHLIYGAATEPNQWGDVLTAVVQSMQGKTGLFYTPFLPPQQQGMLHTLNIPAEKTMLWATKYLEHDLWVNRSMAMGLAVQGAVVIDSDVCTAEELLASEIYQHLFASLDIGRFCSGVVFDTSADGIPATAITAHRSLHAPPFTEQDRAWMVLLLPHLSRALGLMFRLDSARLQTVSLLAGLDKLPLGVALLSPHGQVVHTNRAIQQVLTRQDGLICNHQGRLDGASAVPGVESLESWLQNQSSPTAVEVTHFAHAYTLQRTEAGKVYSIQCCPLNSTTAWQVDHQAVGSVVFVSDPAALVLPSANRLMDLYGLTPAQAQVALHLGRGHSTKEVARALGSSPETVHTHTRQVYQKLRIHSQVDLVRCILTLGQASV